MRVLLDTNILSELRKPAPHPRVIEQVRQIGSEHTFISSITIGELAYGIARLPRSAKRAELDSWLLEIEQHYRSHVLPFDAETAHIWGDLVARMKTAGRALPIQDAQIAATAIQHGLHLMTRNVADFHPTGVLLINPWQDQPDP